MTLRSCAVAAQRGPSPLSLTQAKALGEKLMASLVGGRILGSSLDSGKAIAHECLLKAGFLPAAPESQPTESDSQIDEVLRGLPPEESESRPIASETNGRTDEELRGLFAASALAAIAELERLVSSSGGPFMAGEAPDGADALMASVLLVAHNFVESGVAALPQVVPGSCWGPATSSNVV